MRIGRLLRAGRGRPASLAPDRLDAWLEHLHGQRLTAIDAACAGGGPECFALFADLDTDLWALLLTQEYDAYPNIRALLPSVPDSALQELWNGTVITLPYVRERWSGMFELLDVDVLLGDLYQVMLTLRRR
jgi:hypothetical protein